MPVTPNSLLLASNAAKTLAASANTPAVAAEPGDKASSFARVYADQTPDKSAAAGHGSNEPTRK